MVAIVLVIGVTALPQIPLRGGGMTSPQIALARKGIAQNVVARHVRKHVLELAAVSVGQHAV